jgi:hypothetical protein
MGDPAPLGREAGVSRYLHADEKGERFAVEAIADVEPTLERNRAMQSEGDGYSPSREWRRVASIPPIIQLRWKELYGIEAWNRDHWPGVRRLLNDPDWRWLRTSPGRV